MPISPRRALVTGAFSNIGAATARELLARGWEVATLTNREPAPGDDARIERIALRFDAEHLRAALEGRDVFVNTYWVRFPYRDVTFATAVDNTRLLLDAARAAEVGRFVQVSVSNASADSPLGYYHGKAQVEEDVQASGLSYGIVRPTLVVGPNDVLSNNIAWFVRRFPFIAMPSGSADEYRLQPVTLADTGRIITDVVERVDDCVVDAAGPDILSFREYVQLLAGAAGRRARFLTVPPTVMVGALKLVGPFLRDTILTREELEGLRTNMLVSHEPPLGSESVAAWIAAHGSAYGQAYTNDTLYRFRSV